MKFEIRNRFSDEVQVTADIECADDAATSVKLGLAVRWAFKSGANLSGAYLRSADLRSANLGGAYLRSAYLRSADLRSAYLRSADLRGANLSGAKNIISFGPVGREKRIGYAVAHEDGPRIQLGCFWGTLDEACAAIKAKYGDQSSYEALVRAACAALADNS